MPKFKSILSSWSTRNCIPVVLLLDEWTGLLSDWIVNYILEELIMPKLHLEVDNCDPIKDTMHAHFWIHPWLPIMKNRLEPLYIHFRYKLAVALNSWNPADLSAHDMLAPWMQVFSPGSIEVFLLRNVIPKLEVCLDSMDINPRDQNIEPFYWVMVWSDIILTRHLVNLLNRHFFFKWHQMLAGWLSSHPNYDEVINWYSGWKTKLGHKLISEGVIKNHLKRALDMIHQTVSGTRQPNMNENRLAMTCTDPVLVTNVSNAPKDLIEKLAADNGVTFMPAQQRYGGKTVYWFGKFLIYFDKNAAFVIKSDNLAPL